MILKTKKEYRRGRGIMGFQFYLKYVQYTLVVAPNRAGNSPYDVNSNRMNHFCRLIFLHSHQITGCLICPRTGVGMTYT